MTKRSNCRQLALVLSWLTACAAAAPALSALPRQRRPTQSDRALHVRSIPGVSGRSSAVYEVFMGPYDFEVPALTAVAELQAGTGPAAEGSGASGALVLSQPHPPLGPLLLMGNASGLPPDTRVLVQVRRWGDLRDGCDAPAVGMPFDPLMVSSGTPNVLPAPPPPGDVGAVQTDADGMARVHLMSHVLTLTGPHSALGRAVVLRTLPDGPGSTSDGGKAVACGVVALARYQPPPPPPPPPSPPTLRGTKPSAPDDVPASVEVLGQA